MDDLIKILSKIDDIKALLAVSDDVSEGFPAVKTIYNKPAFLKWKEQALIQLQLLKPAPIIQDTIALLANRFKTGWTDERDFRELQAKIDVILDDIDFFLPTEDGEGFMKIERMAKGTVVHTAFADYELIEQIGSGGNGRVFAAKNSDGEKFAIKFVEKNVSTVKRKRFKNEIYFCESYTHKNIVTIVDRGYAFLDEKGYAFYIMPLYKETLRDKIKAGVSAEDAVDIFIGILEGLKYAHEHGAIHRDIKPENILFPKDKIEPIICDFGIAHFSEENLLTAVETKQADRMANFYYAAPEQYKRGGEICPQTDIYAAGLILNEMFTKEIPQATGYTTIESVNPEYAFLDEVFAQLFKQNPNDRLYPIEKILSEMKLLAENYQRDKEKLRLQSVINEVIDPGKFNALVTQKEYRNGNLIFVFNQNIPDDWYGLITNGSFSHTAMMGYETNHLKRGARNELCMRLRGDEDESTLKRIIQYFNEWVSMVNVLYSNQMKEEARKEQRRKEQLRKAEINKLEKETAISSMLKNL